MSPRAPRISTALALVASLSACADDTVEQTSFGGDASGSSGPVPPDDTGTPTTSSASTTGAPDDPTTGAGTSTDTGDDTTTTGDTTTGDVGTACTRLGGMDPTTGIPALVDAFLARVLVDDRINGYFLNTAVDTAALAGCLSDQLGEHADCPGVDYTCLDMLTAHQGMNIGAQDFADFIENLVDALADHQRSHPGLTDQDLKDVTAPLITGKFEIIEDADDDTSLYHRVGRKPALRTLVGGPDKGGSLLGRITADAAINGFFTGAEFPRLATCLTRQFAAIDGPVVYGAEVDAPDGVEPGVGAGDPCKDMVSAHAGLLDADMNPITIDDFLALLADLGLAAASAGFDPIDRDQLLASVDPLCEAIVVDKNSCPSSHVTAEVGAFDLALPLKDGQYDGSPASMVCVDLEVADDGINFVDDVSLTVAMNHTWIGEVTIKLIGPDATVVTVLSRPGDPKGFLPDNSSNCCGDDSNFADTWPFTFRDGVAISAFDMGKGAMMANNAVVCADESPPHDPCDWKPAPGLAPGVALSDFAGKSAVGTWKVCVGDSSVGDLGSLTSADLVLKKSKYAP